MALYRLEAKIIGRKAGQSIIAAAAYRAGTSLFSERYEKESDYTHKPGVEHSEILLPVIAPHWASNREKHWNAVEDAENRIDAQLAREMVVALPVELSTDQQLELIRDFAKTHFVAKGYAVDFSIHRDNPENPHAHILISLRTLTAKGFTKKRQLTFLQRRKELLNIRKSWADLVNDRLTMANIQTRVDHRSLDAQGNPLRPGVHIGPQDSREMYLAKARMAKNESIQRENGEAITDDPSLALEQLSHNVAVFNLHDIGRFANTHSADPEQFAQVKASILASEDLVDIGTDERGRQVFSTRETIDIEEQLLESGNQLAANNAHSLNEKTIKNALSSKKHRSLSAEQAEMVRHVLSSGALAIVEGAAGTGKSYALNSARQIWESKDYRVLGAALAGKAAEGLENSAGIKSRSLHSLEYALDEGRETLGEKDVLVIDEAGMVGSRQMARILKRAQEAKAKVVIVGDTRQLQAIEAGAPMRQLAAEHGASTLDQIRRQETEWQRNASSDLLAYNARKALNAYDEHGHIKGHDKKVDAIDGLIASWARDRRYHPQEKQMIFAYRRVEVNALNDAARAILHKQGDLGKDTLVLTQTKEGQRMLDFASGDQVMFGQNDAELKVTNGTIGRVMNIKKDKMKVQLEGNRVITVDLRRYNHLAHGYAGTVHKGQGVTVDKAYVLAAKGWDRNLAYVAMTRHKSQLQLHWSKDEFTNQKALATEFMKSKDQKVALDYGKEQKLVSDLNKTIRARQAQPESPKLQRPAPQHKPKKPTAPDTIEAALEIEDAINQEAKDASRALLKARKSKDQNLVDAATSRDSKARIAQRRHQENNPSTPKREPTGHGRGR